MTGLFVLLFFLFGYAILGVAIAWHLKMYAFSRSADAAIWIFFVFALLFGAGAIASYGAINWSAIFAYYPYLFINP